MDPSDVSVQKRIVQTCIECKERRNFDLTDGHTDELKVNYECRGCGHLTTILLDPEED